MKVVRLIHTSWRPSGAVKRAIISFLEEAGSIYMFVCLKEGRYQYDSYVLC